jgi:hypothetical protein
MWITTLWFNYAHTHISASDVVVALVLAVAVLAVVKMTFGEFLNEEFIIYGGCDDE